MHFKFTVSNRRQMSAFSTVWHNTWIINMHGQARLRPPRLAVYEGQLFENGELSKTVLLYSIRMSYMYIHVNVCRTYLMHLEIRRLPAGEIFSGANDGQKFASMIFRRVATASTPWWGGLGRAESNRLYKPFGLLYVGQCTGMFVCLPELQNSVYYWPVDSKNSMLTILYYSFDYYNEHVFVR